MKRKGSDLVTAAGAGSEGALDREEPANRRDGRAVRRNHAARDLRERPSEPVTRRNSRQKSRQAAAPTSRVERWPRFELPRGTPRFDRKRREAELLLE